MQNLEALRIAKLGATSFFKRLPTRKPLTDKVKAVILDWSGTTADAHVLAPAVVFVEVFEKHGVPISMDEARLPMGLRKDLHIGKILEIDDVKKRWKDIRGREPDPDPMGKDVQNLFKDFVPMQLKCLPTYTKLLPGVAETINYLQKKKKIKIGSTTGFTKVMVDILLADAAKQGYVPDSSVAGDQVSNNMGFRPSPFMLYQNLNELGVFPIESVIKVDDTVSGVGEGLNAGCWSVGVAGYSNYTDVDSLGDWEEMVEEEREERREKSRDKLMKSNAHYVIDSLAQLPLVVDEIEARMRSGERP